MSGPERDDWAEVGAAWRRMPTPAPPGRAGWVAVRRRFALLTMLDLVIALLLVALAVAAVREHRGALVWLLGALLAAQGGAIGILANMNRRAVTGLAPESTRDFLVGWCRSCRHQLALIRGLAGLLFAEVATLAVWIVLDSRSGNTRILVQERWWYAALIGLLAVAAWLGVARSRTLNALRRIAAAQAELAGPPET